MSDVKQVKVDNWGIYFLQRLKHFFNRTDYCDLTLQFQDNAQLKVHRLVLSACTEYFELLERTCEMYEDCLVMPDDLQADVVVPIVNFMYTGQLEFKTDLLERLHQTSQIMNMPVLTKLLYAQRKQLPKSSCVAISNYSGVKHYSKVDMTKKTKTPIPSTSNTSNKRSFGKAFDSSMLYNDRPTKKRESVPIASNGVQYCAPSPISSDPIVASRKFVQGEPRPTRYELPEEIEADALLDTSFSNISYTSKPLMVHPETTKRYAGKKPSIFSDASGSRNLLSASTLDIVQCKKITKPEKTNIFDASSESIADGDIFGSSFLNLREESTSKDTSQLFDQILDNNTEVNKAPKVTIETKDNKQAKLDHAKIISEVLKKYPHLMKGNKNIKLKILNTTSKGKKIKPAPSIEVKEEKPERCDSPGFTYETDVLDSKEAAKLIALGAENINGPWICLICGTPGRALHFTTYYKFRRHLVEVHNEKPILSLCEYCGLKSSKRNYLLHHLYTKHNVEPPPQYHFPKCNICNYVALTEGFLVKHKASHAENRNFRCNVCSASFSYSNQLLVHIQKTGHKYSAERNRLNLQCIYCQKVFLRESNLYAHLKINHKHEAKNDGVIEDSDEEKSMSMKSTKVYPEVTKYEVPVSYESEYNDINTQYQIEEKADGNIQVVNKIHKYDNPTTYENQYNNINTQYQIEEKPDGNIQVVTKKASISASTPKQKILNPGFHTTLTKTQKSPKNVQNIGSMHNEFLQDYDVNSPESNSNEEVIMINDNEYIMKDNQLIERKKIHREEYIASDIIHSNADQTFTPTTAMEFSHVYNTNPDEIEHKSETILKKQEINQPIQIVVSNNEEYKTLMSSNHSIIFGDNNDTKTLTVLSNPHNSATLNASAIDLDNTQSNDMMIIQEDYPLNVSDAVVTADNSNIVVVYSHPVDSQNKQYQFITTQNLGTQFVQSSAVITQSNYETVTTSTSAQSIDDTWQNNIQQTIENAQVEIATTTDIQAMTLTEPAKLTPVQTNIHELPAIQLISKHPQTVIVKNPNEEILHQQNDSSENTDQVIDQPVTEETENTTIPMDIDVSSEVVEENNADTVCQDNASIIIEGNKSNVIISNCQESEKNIEQDETNHEITATVQMESQETELIVEESSEKLEDDSKIAIEKTEVNNVTTEKTEANVIAAEITVGVENAVITEEIENPDIDKMTNTEVVTEVTDHENSNVANEQIQNLASEWSEEEGDDTSTQENEIIKKDKNDKEEKSETQVEVEVEESVENIQQELQKQMLTTHVEESEGDDPKDASSSSQEQEEPSQKKNGTNKKADAPLEKISSLLNDWDENDSQDASIADTNGNETNSPKPNESHTPVTSAVIEIEPQPDTVPPEKTDKIKNLVSDWDDDEEERSETEKENK